MAYRTPSHTASLKKGCAEASRAPVPHTDNILPSDNSMKSNLCLYLLFDSCLATRTETAYTTQNLHDNLRTAVLRPTPLITAEDGERRAEHCVEHPALIRALAAQPRRRRLVRR